MFVLRKRLILASTSPRRQALLRQIGLPYEVRASGVDERAKGPEEPSAHVVSLSQHKAEAVARGVDDAYVLGADTIVVLDGRILGKPEVESEAAEMLRSLSGRWHDVYTGFTVQDRPTDTRVSEVETTRVKFRDLGAAEIRSYVRSGSPMDKAGGYGIQDDYGAVFVERIEGCFYTVVGLPLARLYSTIMNFEKRLSTL